MNNLFDLHMNLDDISLRYHRTFCLFSICDVCMTCIANFVSSAILYHFFKIDIYWYHYVEFGAFRNGLKPKQSCRSTGLSAQPRSIVENDWRDELVPTVKSVCTKCGVFNCLLKFIKDEGSRNKGVWCMTCVVMWRYRLVGTRANFGLNFLGLAGYWPQLN